MPIVLTTEPASPRPATSDAAFAPRHRLSSELSDFVNRAVGPDFVPHVARLVGDSEARTEAAFTLLFSAAVRRIARAAESREATERLFALLHGRQVAVDLSDALTRLLGARKTDADGPPDAADRAAHALFGNKAGSLVLSVGAATGMPFDSVWRLACLVTPFAYAALADYCARNDLDATGLRRLLASERIGSQRSHRRRLGETLRESGGRAVDATFDGGARAMTRTRAALDGARTRISAARGARLVLPVLLVAAVAAAAFLSRDADHPEMPTAATARTLAAVTLPDGQSLQAARGGVIDRMVAFLSEEGIKDEKVFLLDGIQFDDRSATLRSASLAKLEQVAAVLAAFPGARVDIEAPAGSLGDPERERDLAEHRALAVRAALGSFGIRPSRMTHAAATRAAGSETGVSQFSDGVIALRVTTG